MHKKTMKIIKWVVRGVCFAHNIIHFMFLYIKSLQSIKNGHLRPIIGAEMKNILKCLQGFTLSPCFCLRI